MDRPGLQVAMGPLGLYDNVAKGGPPPYSRQLDDMLRLRLDEVVITKAEFKIARTCLKELESLFGEMGWKVRPFGSLCNGFAMHGSDLDVTCCHNDGDQDGFPTALQMLEQALPLFQASEKFKIVDAIKAAMVPIIKVNFQQVLDVDLSFKNAGPLPNTQLLRAYYELDPRVRELVVMVKLWANAAGVCGAANGYLSAYSFTLMAIYFLQVDPRCRMPCLNTQLFKGEQGGVPKEASVSWSWCRLGKSELLFSFFCFFAREFRWCSEVVSIRAGRRSPASDPVFEQLKGRAEERLHIEDPFQLGRNLHCVLRVENEYVLYDKLWEAMQAMFHCDVLPGLAPQQPPGWAAKELGKAAMASVFGALPSPAPVELATGHLAHLVAASRPSGMAALAGPPSDAESGRGPLPHEVPMPRLQLKWTF